MKIIPIREARSAIEPKRCETAPLIPGRAVVEATVAGMQGDLSSMGLEFPNTVEALDIRAPRYTSYPTADRFIEAFGAEDYARHLGARVVGVGLPLSVYVHIPFCEQLCFYCACNKTITQNYGKAPPYVQRLIEEVELVHDHLDNDRRLVQMHWGGGTPTFLRENELRTLMAGLRKRFEFSERGEYAIEVDPRTVDGEKLGLLAELGFNRISLGIQDFDAGVQQAVNRIQPVEMVEEVLDTVRKLGFRSTNFDLIYGLPRQTVQSYTATIESIIAMRPERIALYNYAHLPARFKAQRQIDEVDMPTDDVKMAIFEMANELLDSAGYEYIGMDHFALPDDELAVAHRAGRLHRNFQGYSTQPDCDLVALGASAISRIGACYSQNLRGVNEYCDRVSQGILPTLRGIELSRDDVLRRALIMGIMCQGEIDKASVEIAHLIEFDSYFKTELITLKPLEDLGFVELSDEAIIVTALGRRKALRIIGTVFDRYLRERETRSEFSRVL